MAEGIIGIQSECFVEILFRFLNFPMNRQELGISAEHLGVARMGLDDVCHFPQCGFMLAGIIESKRLLDIGVNLLAAPLKLLSATARTHVVGVNRHSAALSAIVAGAGPICG